MVLSPQQLADFDRDGVVMLGKVLEDDELREGQQRLRRILEGGKVFQDLYAPGEANPTGQRHLRTNNVWLHDDWYKSLLYHPRLLGIITSVLGPNIQLLHDQAFYKPAFDGAPSLWHNDNWYWHIQPANAASIWIALTDVELDNACLYFVPGSHHEPLPPEEMIVDTGKMKLQHLQIDESRTKPYVMPAGHALMHHCQTIHGAYPNTSGRDRLAHAIHYVQSGVVAHGSNTFADTDLYPVLHGERVTPNPI